MNNHSSIKKTLTINSAVLQNVKYNSQMSQLQQMRDRKLNFEQKSRNSSSVQQSVKKQQPLFKKTLSRALMSQIVYVLNETIVRRKLSLDEIQNRYTKDFLLNQIAMMSRINQTEWLYFQKSKVMSNFIVQNLEYLFINYEKICAIIHNFSKNNHMFQSEVNFSICLSAIAEFLLYVQKNDLQFSVENVDGENVEEQSNTAAANLVDQKKIIINEYLQITANFADEVYVKYVNNVLENAFSNIIENSEYYL